MNPTRTRRLLAAVCLGLFDLMATTAQAGDTTEQPIKQLNEASDLRANLSGRLSDSRSEAA